MVVSYTVSTGNITCEELIMWKFMWKWIKKILWWCSIVLPAWAGVCLLGRTFLFAVKWPFKLMFRGGLKGRVKKFLCMDYDMFCEEIHSGGGEYWEEQVQQMCKKHNIPEKQMTRLFRHHFSFGHFWTLKTIMKA
jgi:hypothetical protein